VSIAPRLVHYAFVAFYLYQQHENQNKYHNAGYAHPSAPPSFAASNPLQNFTFLQEMVGNDNPNTLQLYHTAHSF
jgi:hypothetical protein